MDFHFNNGLGSNTVYFLCLLISVHIILNFPWKIHFITPGHLTTADHPFQQVMLLQMLYHVFLQCFAVYAITHNAYAVLISFLAYFMLDLGRAWNRLTMLSEELIHLIVKVLLVLFLDLVAQ